MMATYRYRAIASGGAILTGVLEAASSGAAVDRLRELGHYPVSARLAAERFPKALSLNLRGAARHASHRHLAIATQELATLLDSGLDLDRALSVLERLGDLGPLQKSFAMVRLRLQEGADFGDALAEHAEFPKYFVSAVRAGEVGGTLQATLRRLSDYVSRTAAVRNMIASALLYPIILLATAGLSIIFILTFVLPEFQPLFAEAGRALPWPTRVLMGLSNAVRHFWWLILLALAATVLFVRAALQNPARRALLDRKLLRLAIIGPLLLAIDIERFSRTLGTLLTNGVPLPSALPLAAEVIGNRTLSAAMSESLEGLREGEHFASRLERTGIIPAVTIDLIRVGEESGRLDEMLLRQADLDEQRIRHSVERLLALLVPALTIILGLMVGALIASLLTAILSVNDLALPG